MIDRSTNIREALRKRQHGFIINPFAFASPGGGSFFTATLWLDAQVYASFTISDTDKIDQWADQSGNGHHVTNTSTARPSYDATALNGLPCMVNASGTSLNTSSSLGTAIFGDASDVTIAAVFQTTDTANHTLFSCINGGDRILAHTPYGAATSYFDAATEWGARISGAQTWSSASVGIFTRDGSNMRARANGTQWASRSNAASTASFGTGTVGLGHVLSANYLVGRIGEFIVCDAALSSTDEEKMEGYLAHKWDIADSLPGDHPYKSAPP